MKEFSKKRECVNIDNIKSFRVNLQEFLDKYPDVKIIETIVHKPYHVTIIYERLIPINRSNNLL